VCDFNDDGYYIHHDENSKNSQIFSHINEYIPIVDNKLNQNYNVIIENINKLKPFHDINNNLLINYTIINLKECIKLYGKEHMIKDEIAKIDEHDEILNKLTNDEIVYILYKYGIKINIQNIPEHRCKIFNILTVYIFTLR